MPKTRPADQRTQAPTGESFTVKWKGKAKQCKPFSGELKQRLHKLLDELSTTPVPPQATALQGKAFKRHGLNLFRARIGDYRVVYDLDIRQRCIDILLVDHRDTIYKRLERRLGIL